MLKRKSATTKTNNTLVILISGFASVMLLFVLVAVLMLWAFSSYHQDLEQIHTLERTAALESNIGDNMRAQGLAYTNMVLRRNISLENTFSFHKDRLEKELLPKIKQADLLPIEKDQLASVFLAYDQIDKNYLSGLQAIKNGDYIDATGTWRYEISPYLAVALQYTDKLSGMLYERVEVTTKEANDALLQKEWWIIFGTIGAFILGGLVAALTIRAINNQNKSLRHTLNDLQVANQQIEQRQKTSEEVSSNVLTLAAELKINAGQQTSASQRQVSAVAEVNSSVNELSVTASSIAELAGEVSQIAQTMAEESQHIEDTTKRSVTAGEKGITAVSQTVLVSTEVADLYQELVGILNELNTKNGNMRRILDLLSNIASETHLLALNAAIEAAGAGEYGERFQIVAQEVKSLANRSAAAGKEVLGIVQEIENSIGEAVNSAQGGYQKAVKMEEVAVEAGKVMEGMQQVSKSSQQQARTIGDKVRDVRNLTEMIKVSTSQQRTASRQVLEALEGLGIIAQQNAAGSNQVASTATRLEAVSHNLNEVLVAA